MKHTPKVGETVDWATSQGETTGVVVDEVTHESHVKGHTAKASDAAPQFKVKSKKTGKTAIHKAEALKPHG